MSDTLSDEQIADMVTVFSRVSGRFHWPSAAAALRELQQRRALAALPAQQASARPDVAALVTEVAAKHAPRYYTGLPLLDGFKDAIREALSRVPAPAASVDLEQIAIEAADAERAAGRELVQFGRGDGWETVGTLSAVILAALQRARETGSPT